mgnify:FL=1
MGWLLLVHNSYFTSLCTRLQDAISTYFIRSIVETDAEVGSLHRNIIQAYLCSVTTPHDSITDITYKHKGDRPDNISLKLNPNNPNDLVCAIDGRPDPTFVWTSSIKETLPAKSGTLSMNVASRQSGEVEVITCKGIVGELDLLFRFFIRIIQRKAS